MWTVRAVVKSNEIKCLEAFYEAQYFQTFNFIYVDTCFPTYDGCCPDHTHLFFFVEIILVSAVLVRSVHQVKRQKNNSFPRDTDVFSFFS